MHLDEDAVRARWAALIGTKLCSVWTCDRPAWKRQLCQLHYRRWHRTAAAGLLFTRTLPGPTEAELEALA